MEILGIGASELIFILIIAIIVLGPKDMQKAGRTLGRWLNQLVRSDSWKVFQKTSTELRNLPRNLMREANMELEDVNKELQDVNKEINEIPQTIDPRSRPSAYSASRTPSTEPKAGQTPSKQTDAPPPSPTDNTEQHD
ncbi:MAG TPA: twin-arginine translocase TatA/TatE family subunit [Anaerolineales bacterium]|nr:twin-arginine translocase TatA/TatE family subunit [Anaerolineales bacterium]